MEINQILFLLRSAKKLSQQNVADEIGVDITTYNRYEKGTTEPKLSHIRKLAELYRLTLDEFFNYNNPSYSQVNTGSELVKSVANQIKIGEETEVSINIKVNGDEEKLENNIGLLRDLNKLVKTRLKIKH
jgi:transcriptional regulator with XRE-family HTH domain